MTTHNSINAPALSNKGDLLLGQGGGLDPAVLSAGSNGFVLTLDDTTPTGTKWASSGGGGGASLSPYIVGATGSDFTTIQSAIDQAVTDGAANTDPKNIYIKPGTYNENLTLHDGINLIGFDSSPATIPLGIGLFAVSSQSVQITGSVTYDSSAIGSSVEFRIYNVWFNPSSGDTVILSGNPGLDQRFYFYGCRIDVSQTGQSPFNMTNATILMADSTINDKSAGGCPLFSLSGDNYFYASRSLITPRTTYTVSDGVSHTVSLRECLYAAQASTSGTSSYSFTCYNSTHFTTAQNAPYHTIGASTDGTIIYSHCDITSSPLFNVATISSSEFNTFVTNCYFGRAGNNASDVFSGGNVQFNNSSVQNSNGVFQRFQGIVSGFNGSSSYTSQSGLQTSGNTAQTLASVTLNESESITLSGTITAAKDDHTDMVGGNFLICARRSSGGNVTLIGSPVINVESSSAASFTCDVDVSTQTVRIRITGVVGETYNWTCSYTYQKVLTNS